MTESNSQGYRDLIFGRLLLPTLSDEVQEAVGDALSADESGVAVARRRPRQFTLQIPVYGTAGDSNEYTAGMRMRRQLRAMMENSQLRLQGLYFGLAFDPELSGWMLAGSGQIKYSAGGVALAQFSMELDSAFRVGSFRSHRPARRVELYDRRLVTTPRDYRGTIYGTDFSALTALSLTPLPVGASDPLGYGHLPVAAFARAGLDGTGYLLQGLQHANVIDYEQNEVEHNKGDVVIYDRRTLTTTPPEDGEGSNLITTPNFERSAIGIGNWSAAATGLGAGATITRSIEAGFTGEASGKVVATATAAKEGAGIAMSGTFRSGTAYTFAVYLKGSAGGEKLTVSLGILGTDSAGTNVTLTTSWQRVLVTWTPTAERTTANAMVYTQAATAATWFMDAAMACEGATATNYGDGDVANWSWVGNTPGNAISTRDPQVIYGWEEVYGPEQTLTPGDCVVMQNQLCRVRYVAATNSFAIDKWSSSEVWAEQGRITVYDSTAADTYNQHTYAIPRSGTSGASGVLGTVLEYTPERGVIKISTARSSSTISTARIDLYITLQRGWLGPRFEVYASAVLPATPTAGAQIRWTPNTEANMAVVLPTTAASGDDPLFPWASTTGPTFASTAEPWVTSFPVAGGQITTLVSLQQAARSPRYSDNAAYGGGNRQSIGISARTGETQVNASNYVIYGYVSAFIMLMQTAQPNALASATAHKVGGTEVADAGAIGGKAIKAENALATKVYEVALPSQGQYQVWVRVRAESGTTARVVAEAGAEVSAEPTTTSATYVYLSLGQFLAKAGSKLSVLLSAGTGKSAFLDRVIVLPLQLREGSTPTFDGVRDLAVQHLFDSQTVPELVERS